MRQNIGLSAYYIFRVGAADVLGCAKGLQRPRCGCSGCPASRVGGFSPLNQTTTAHRFAWPVSVKWGIPCPGGQTPRLYFDIFPYFCGLLVTFG